MNSYLHSKILPFTFEASTLPAAQKPTVQWSEAMRLCVPARKHISRYSQSSRISCILWTAQEYTQWKQKIQQYNQQIIQQKNYKSTIHHSYNASPNFRSSTLLKVDNVDSTTAWLDKVSYFCFVLIWKFFLESLLWRSDHESSCQKQFPTLNNISP